MKLLILGGSGMLGHQLRWHFRSAHKVWVTTRHPAEAYADPSLLMDSQIISGIDVADFGAVERVIAEIRPDAVLNCVGIVKQIREAKNPIPSIIVNALLPHRLAELCGKAGVRLVLFSTDCVFSGHRGRYTEADVPDAEDLYGRTKILGEVTDQSHVITLRSSIIGRELSSAHGLIEWFLSQHGRVHGYRRAIYSGFTTIEMGRIVESVLLSHRDLHGLWQVASAPISKYDLLCLVKKAFKRPVEIVPDDSFVCDRSLDGSRFAAATGYRAPSWPIMIRDMMEQSVTDQP